ncbi:MAG: CdaR family protein [Nitrospirae bacterium]|nr:CdaR family protein [Nitrospirota bacterium]
MNIQTILFDNWGIKLVSLGLSLTLWFYVTSKGKTEMTITVPLELRNIPQDMAVVGNVAGSLEVRIQGQERILRDTTVAEKMVGVIDLSMTKVGENTVHISPDDIKRPAEVTVTHMSLSEITVKLEPLVRKIFRLKPILHGAPAAGHRIVKIIVTPSKITVEGPESLMTALSRLQTMPIDINDAKETMTVEPKIDYQGQPVKLLEKNIMVQIIIERVNR